MWTVKFLMFKLVLEKAEDQRSNCQHMLDHQKSKRIPEKHLFLLYWLCQGFWLCGSQKTEENSERDEKTIPSEFLRNLCAGQETTVRTGHGTTDCFQIGNGVRQSCILSPCLFNFYAEYIMRNAGLEEARAGIKIARRNINDLRDADHTTLMAENEELKSLLMKGKRRVKKLA